MLLINDYINMIYEIVKLKLINDLLKKSLLIFIKLKIDIYYNSNKKFLSFFRRFEILRYIISLSNT